MGESLMPSRARKPSFARFRRGVPSSEFLGPGCLDHAELRQPHRDMGEQRGDVVGRDRPQQQRRHMYAVGPGAGRGGLHGLVKRRGAHHGVRTVVCRARSSCAALAWN
ncbi:hypothetical protein [Streptomyces sp. NPDC016675]|uniref:hypothetical protein n=1 Tax=Streptomyces sp. NPDC016675 TaxID=3364970 RepID=UPI0036FDB6F4